VARTVFDLARITDRVVSDLEALFQSDEIWVPTTDIERFDVTVSASMPESVRDKGGCQLSWYLVHASEDPAWRNTPADNRPGAHMPQGNRSRPQGLDLSYLLTAFAKDNAIQEQQAMSIAMRYFHEQAILLPRLFYPFHLTVTMETQNLDEASRLWQALSAPLRMGVVYRVAVVFMEPTEEPAPVGPPPRLVRLVVGAAELESLEVAQLLGPAIRADFQVPVNSTRESVDLVTSSIAPEEFKPGDRILVAGLNLDAVGYQNVFLRLIDGVDTNITIWQANRTPSRLVLNVPTGATAPAPGWYLLSLGHDQPTPVRSNAVALRLVAP